MAQLKIPTVFMRGGASKGLFFVADDIPDDPVQRDRALLRALGSPDRYGAQMDGMGCGTSSTSKVVILSRSKRTDCDVDYLFGAVAIDQPLIDWSGNCGNLTAAVGPFAIRAGLLKAPADGEALVRIWQSNICRKIHARVQMRHGEVQEVGEFYIDGVAFPSSEIKLEFLDPAGDQSSGGGEDLLPTGAVVDKLDVPGFGEIKATLINAGLPTILVEAADLGMSGAERQIDVNGDSGLLALAEQIRCQGAVAMGLAETARQATETRPHTPKLLCLARPRTYLASDGKTVNGGAIDLLVRAFSMGRLHHAMPAACAVAVASAAVIPDTLVHRIIGREAVGPVRCGHASGRLDVGAEARRENGRWTISRVFLSRSARRLMEGFVYIPEV